MFWKVSLFLQSLLWLSQCACWSLFSSRHRMSVYRHFPITQPYRASVVWPFNVMKAFCFEYKFDFFTTQILSALIHQTKYFQYSNTKFRTSTSTGQQNENIGPITGSPTISCRNIEFFLATEYMVFLRPEWIGFYCFSH